MWTIRMNDGTEISGHLTEVNGLLFLYMNGIGFAEAFELLIDPEKTKKIVSIQDKNETTVKGYKHLYTVTEEASGMITAGLKK